MGLFGSTWEATHEGHTIAVHRNEVTKGFSLVCDGTVIARRAWSWLGLGQLRGQAEIAGRSVCIDAALDWGGGWKLRGKCTIAVGGVEIPSRYIG